MSRQPNDLMPCGRCLLCLSYVSILCDVICKTRQGLYCSISEVRSGSHFGILDLEFQGSARDALTSPSSLWGIIQFNSIILSRGACPTLASLFEVVLHEIYLACEDDWRDGSLYALRQSLTYLALCSPNEEDMSSLSPRRTSDVDVPRCRPLSIIFHKVDCILLCREADPCMSPNTPWCSFFALGCCPSKHSLPSSLLSRDLSSLDCSKKSL